VSSLRTSPNKKARGELNPERVWEVKHPSHPEKCLGKPGIVTEESKAPDVQLSPLLYYLTSLQATATSALGFSAKNTLDSPRLLYEKHKVLTYPRTDSRALPEDYIETRKKALGMLVKPLASFVRAHSQDDWVQPKQRIFQQRQGLRPLSIIHLDRTQESE